MKETVREFLATRAAFLAFIAAVVSDHKVELLEPQIDAHESLDGWDAQDLATIVEEGRRRRDDEVATLAGLRSRAQLVLSTSLVVLAALAGIVEAFTLRTPTFGDLVSGVGFISGLLAALGAAAIIVVPAPMGVVDLNHLSKPSRDGDRPLRRLADQLLAIQGQNRSVVRTWHTHFFECVIWLLVSAGCTVLIFL